VQPIEAHPQPIPIQNRPKTSPEKADILRKSAKHLCQFSQLFHVEQFRGVEQSERRCHAKPVPRRQILRKFKSTSVANVTIVPRGTISKRETV
jgi:hypothetical protein